MRLKSLAKEWCPPAIIHAIHRLRQGDVRFESGYATWEEAAAQCTGYNEEHILSKVLEATLRVRRGEAAFERDSVEFAEIEYAWPVTAGLMWAAARHGGTLNVLDFGGSLGSTYFQNHRFLQQLDIVRWNIVEQPHYTQAGKQHVQDKTLYFYDSIAECLTETQPNVVLLSSVLQYLAGYESILNDIASVGAKLLIIDRTPFSVREEVVIQRVPSSIYAASYPMRIFSKSNFLDSLDPSWSLVASTLSAEGHTRSTAGTCFSFEGMLMESKQ